MRFGMNSNNRWFLIAIVGLVGAGAGYAFLVRPNAGKSISSEIGAKTAPVKVAPGTKIPLTLMQELESGGTPTGTKVSFMVNQDVEADGTVAIPKGSVVIGEVSWSRREGSLDGLMQRPARLNLKFKEAILADGKTVPIGGSPDSDEFEFNRDNTTPDREPEATSENPAVEEALTKLRTKLLESDPDLREEDLSPLLEGLAGNLKLQSTERILKQNELSEVNQLLKQLKGTGGVASLATGQAELAIAAVQELAQLANGVGRRMDRMLRGRNIKAYMGTEIELVVRDSASLNKKK
jgi:hypothetical protein